MKNIKTILCGGLVAMLVSCSSQMTTTNYYFDSVNGDDANNGTSVGTPFKSLAKLQSLTKRWRQYFVEIRCCIYGETFAFLLWRGE